MGFSALAVKWFEMGMAYVRSEGKKDRNATTGQMEKGGEKERKLMFNQTTFTKKNNFRTNYSAREEGGSALPYLPYYDEMP